jgi:hypothetical protein
MKRKYLTVRELLTATPEFMSEVVSETRKDGYYRCSSKGSVHNVVYNTHNSTLEWSDSDGDPRVADIGIDDAIEFRGSGKWTYGLYTEEEIEIFL